MSNRQCSYVFSATSTTAMTCTAPAREDTGIARCWSHGDDGLPGYIYVLTWGGYAKVGYSSNPIGRLRQLLLTSNTTLMPPVQQGSIELVGAVRGDIAAERLIHAALASDRAEGEWFRNTPAVMAVVEEMTRNPFGEVPKDDKPVVPADF